MCHTSVNCLFYLLSLCADLEFWSVNHALMYENYDLKSFENIKLLGERPNN